MAARKKVAKKKAGRKSTGRKKPAKRKPAKRKTPSTKGRRKPTTPSTHRPVRISAGLAYPGSLPVKRGDTVQWTNSGGTRYTIHFDHSPFLPGRKAQNIAVPARGASAVHTVHQAKPRGDYEYDIIGSKASAPPGEPQVTIED